jgi:hypothetical protein
MLVSSYPSQIQTINIANFGKISLVTARPLLVPGIFFKNQILKNIW